MATESGSSPGGTSERVFYEQWFSRKMRKKRRDEVREIAI
jgi:hypothetical protein